MKNLFNIVAVAAVAILLAGCATPIVTPGAPASTNAVTGAVAPAVAPVTNYVPNTTVATAAMYGTAAAPYVPAPYGGILTALLAVATTVTGYIAAQKNGQLNTANGIAATIIQGVESAGTAASAVKSSVAKTAAANGNSDAVEAAVNKIVGSA